MNDRERVVALLRQREEGLVDEVMLTQFLAALIMQWLAGINGLTKPLTWVGSAQGAMGNLEALNLGLTGLVHLEDMEKAMIFLKDEGSIAEVESEERILHGSPTLYMWRPTVPTK